MYKNTFLPDFISLESECSTQSKGTKATKINGNNELIGQATHNKIPERIAKPIRFNTLI